MFNRLVCIERRWCGPQNPADRPDTKDASKLVNEDNHRLSGRSSSAAAKYALACFSISLVVRSLWFSHPNSLIRSFSALVSPAADRPHARPAGTTHEDCRGSTQLRRDTTVRRAIAGVNGTVFLKQPNTAFAKFSRIGGGESSLRHRAHPLSVLLSGKPGAVQHSQRITVPREIWTLIFAKRCFGRSACR